MSLMMTFTIFPESTSLFGGISFFQVLSSKNEHLLLVLGGTDEEHRIYLFCDILSYFVIGLFSLTVVCPHSGFLIYLMNLHHVLSLTL